MKLGRWSGSIKHLISRYKVTYGTDLMVIVFQCTNSNDVEREMFTALKAFHWSNELYEVNVLPAFMQFCTKLDDHVNTTAQRMHKWCQEGKSRLKQTLAVTPMQFKADTTQKKGLIHYAHA